MAPRRPNILFVICDELRAQAVPPTREDPTVTPHLDRFAGEALALTDMVATSPVCSPYRALLLSGRYPHANGVLENCNSDQEGTANYLKPEEVCFTDVLAANGYQCGYIGKWHLDHPDPASYAHTEGRRRDGRVWDSFTPPGAGRHGCAFWYAYGVYDNHFYPHYWTGDGGIEERIDVHRWSVRHETDVAIDYLRNTSGQRDPEAPFCLVVSHNPPHMPFNRVPAEYRRAYSTLGPERLLNRGNVSLQQQGAQAAEAVEGYFAAVTGIDEQFGRLLACLEEQGLADDTIVIFSADHGEMMGSHGRIGKGVWYEESLRIPFLLRWPGRIEPRQDDLLMGGADVHPTLLGLAGLADAIPPQVQGTDYAPLLRGAAMPRPTSAFYLLLDNAHPELGRRGIRTHRHTFVRIRESDAPEQLILHDNRADPFQLRNAAADNPALVRTLAAELDGWLQRTGDPWQRTPPP